MKRFNTPIFLTAFVLIGFVLMISLVAAAAEDEGTIGDSRTWIVFAKLFYVLRFPTNTILWNVFSENAIIYLSGLLINVLFWSLLIERIVLIFKKIQH